MNAHRLINNQYLVIKEIGIGGFATVYKAWDGMLCKFVAVKKIFEEYSSDAKYVDMFRNEAVNTAKLEHDNIVRVINFIKDEAGGYFIVMDYVNGVDLEYLLKKCRDNSKKIPPGLALYIISMVLRALDYAHAAKDNLTGELLNIIHRDITPGNVMLYYDGRIKITDFGIARFGNESQNSSDKGKLKGKIAYMSPEQANASVEIDARSDLFGCGIILYEMITGTKAFTGSTDLDVIQKVQKAEIDFKKLKDLNISQDIQEILKKALQKSPDKRYKNAAEMFLDIRRCLNKNIKLEKLIQGYKAFIETTLDKEIKLYKEEAEQDLKCDFQSMVQELKEYTVEKQDTIKLKHESLDPESELEEVKPEREEVVENRNKKVNIFVRLVAPVVMLMALFLMIDVYAQLTVFGAGIHGIFWPPALKIDSVPSGARLKLIKGKENVLLNLQTPAYIEKIRSGVYTLVLLNENYGEVIRKITVFGKHRDGQSISIPGAKVIDDIYIIPFEVVVEINSVPSEAELFIDGYKVGKTPYSGYLEVGDHNFYLVKDGYDTLGARNPEIGYSDGMCYINTNKAVDEQNKIDYSYWDIQKAVTDSGNKKFILTAEMNRKL